MRLFSSRYGHAYVAASFLALSGALGACASLGGPKGEAAFAPTMADCERDSDKCRTECAASPPDQNACDALSLLQAEDFVQSHKTTLEPPQQEALARTVKGICDKGIQRACKDAPLLADVMKHDVGAREDEATEARAEELARQALAIASLSAPGFTSCADARTPTPLVHAACAARDVAEAVRRCLAGCDSCSPGCKVELRNAEAAFNAAQTLASDEAATARATKAAADEKGASERAAADVETEEVLRQEQACLVDLPACKRACAAAPGSSSCGLLADAYTMGRGDVTVDIKEATRLARGGCEASKSPNKIACAVQKHLEGEAKSCSGDTCKLYCDAAKCGYAPGRTCLYADACTKVALDVLASTPGAAGQAVTWFDKGCAAESTRACSELGMLYFAGKGVPKDMAKAESILKRACDLQLVATRANASRVADTETFARMQATCHAHEDAVCMNKVETASRRRAAKDSVCVGAGAPSNAYATLNGTDKDGCEGAMTKAGCQEIEGQGLYCCPP